MIRFVLSILRSAKASLVAGIVLGCSLSLADTPGFRGNGNGQFPAAKPPLKWSEDNGVAWSAPLPGKSHSSPILVKNRVLISSDPAELLCLDATSGEVLWQRSHDYADVLPERELQQIAKERQALASLELKIKELIQKQRALQKADEPNEELIKSLKTMIRELRKEKTSKTNYPSVKRGGSGNSAATPVSDGQRVYVAYAHGVVACHTLDGERQWAKHFPPATSNFGHSASPVVVGNRLLIQFRDLAALDTETGNEVWRVDVKVRWGTPVTTRLGDTPVAVTAGGDMIEISNGKILSQKMFSLGHNSPILQDGVLYALDAGKFRALKMPDSVNSEPAVLWETSTSRQRTFASPLYHQGLLYQLTETGILTVADATTGESVYRKRLDFGKRARVFSSVTLAGKNIFLASENGTCLVIKPGREFSEVARNQLKGFYGSPIFEGSRMFARGKDRLYCIRQE